MTTGVGHSPRTPKARQLSRLAAWVEVPPFVVLGRETRQVEHPRGACARYMVRGCMLDEDTPESSAAGRSPTRGPVSARAVPQAVRRVFADPRVVEVVVQAYREGPSGVVFCTNRDEALVEYGSGLGDVTAGRTNPFAALLADAPARYRALAEGVRRVFDAFGPCDLEFVGLDDPAFVQVRPISAELRHDPEWIRLKMALQELPTVAWEQTAYCVDLMERPECDDALVSLFLDSIPGVYEELLGRVPELPEHAFLKIGRQWFSSNALSRALRLRPFEGFRLGRRARELIGGAREVLDEESAADPARLMRTSIALNLLDETLARWMPAQARKVFELRERCRQRLATSCPPGTRPPDVPFPRRLSPRIERDDERLRWAHLSLQAGPGTVVVAGDFETGPFFVYERDPQAVPEGVVLVTPELYPEIGDVLDRVRGIVSEGGAYGSHLAILAREQRVPLLVQATDLVRRLRAEP